MESTQSGSRPLVTVHPYTNQPSKAWDQLKMHQYVTSVKPMSADTPVRTDAVRFVCLSDTHSAMCRMKHRIPPGDVLLHAGDFSRYGSLEEIDEFNRFLGSLPHRHKVVIAGNHELTFDPSFYHCAAPNGMQFPQANYVKQRLTNCTYLEDQEHLVYGIKIYGSPWQPMFCKWAFNLPRGQALLDIWNKIPDDTDVLLTHTPPIGHGDFCVKGMNVGCVELLSVVQKRVKPRYHVFGHIHEGYGITTDGQTMFVNAAICNVHYKPVNAPIIFDIRLPEGASKV